MKNKVFLILSIVINLFLIIFICISEQKRSENIEIINETQELIVSEKEKGITITINFTETNDISFFNMQCQNYKQNLIFALEDGVLFGLQYQDDSYNFDIKANAPVQDCDAILEILKKDKLSENMIYHSLTKIDLMGNVISY